MIPGATRRPWRRPAVNSPDKTARSCRRPFAAGSTGSWARGGRWRTPARAGRVLSPRVATTRWRSTACSTGTAGGDARTSSTKGSWPILPRIRRSRRTRRRRWYARGPPNPTSGIINSFFFNRQTHVPSKRFPSTLADRHHPYDDRNRETRSSARTKTSERRWARKETRRAPRRWRCA